MDVQTAERYRLVVEDQRSDTKVDEVDPRQGTEELVGYHEQLPAAEVGDAILYFTSRFVREDRVHEFLSAYFTLMPVKKSVFRAARTVHGLTHLADSTHLKLERTFTACIHYPLLGRPVAFKVQGRSVELMRLFQIQGPGLAINTGRASVAWFSSVGGDHYVLHRE